MDATITDFVNEARQYCTLIKHHQSDTRSWTFADECLRSVLGLYRSALALPELESGEYERPLDPIEHAEWRAIRMSVAQRLSTDLYWEVFEPLEEQLPQPVVGSISDDLADIWRDVQVALQHFEKGTETGQRTAVWHWRFSMETHWARHAVGAARALTALCFGPRADASRP